MDVTPIIPADRQVIDGYTPHGFRVSGIVHEGAVLVLPHRTESWRVTGLADISLENLRPILDAGGVEILLLGCGRRMVLVPPALRQGLREKGIVVDAMDTGAACRTYNILLAEDRHVAAALLPAG